MWLFTPRGYYSVATYEDGLNIRARNRQDLLNLADLLPQANEPLYLSHADYPWRFQCSHEDWAKACAAMAQEIDYPKFKEAVRAKQGPARYQNYSTIWGITLDLEDEEFPGVYTAA